MEHGKQWPNRLLVADMQHQTAATRRMLPAGQRRR